MDTTLDQEENQNSICVIKRKLAALKPVPYRRFYEWKIGYYLVRIFPPSHSTVKMDEILSWTNVDITLSDLYKSTDSKVVESYIDMIFHPLFKDYEPIQYNVITTPNGTINLSNGLNMPIDHLCELIRYLYRLTNLTAFL